MESEMLSKSDIEYGMENNTTELNKEDKMYLEAMVEDLMAENQLLRSQRARLLASKRHHEDDNMMIHGDSIMKIEDQTNFIEQLSSLREKMDHVTSERRRLSDELHKAQVDLLQMVPLRSKIAELQTTVSHLEAKINHLEEQLATQKKMLDKKKLQMTIMTSKQDEQRLRIESLNATIGKLENDKKGLRSSLQEIQMELRNKENWWNKRLGDDIANISENRDKWRERAVALASTLRRVRYPTTKNELKGVKTNDADKKNDGQCVGNNASGSLSQSPMSKDQHTISTKSKHKKDVVVEFPPHPSEETNLSDQGSTDEANTLLLAKYSSTLTDEANTKYSSTVDDGCVNSSCKFF
jgi:outer membrane murein-binding lipoprotein Lpp